MGVSEPLQEHLFISKHRDCVAIVLPFMHDTCEPEVGQACMRSSSVFIEPTCTRHKVEYIHWHCSLGEHARHFLTLQSSLLIAHLVLLGGRCCCISVQGMQAALMAKLPMRAQRALHDCLQRCCCG